MDKIVAAFESEKSRNHIVDMLESGGISLRGVYKSGAEAIRAVRKMGGGIVICGFKLADMTAEQLAADLNGVASILVMAKAVQLAHLPSDIFKLATPATRSDLIASVKMLQQIEEKYMRYRMPRRDPEQERIIREAKELLMDRNGFTENDAHRFIQRLSMETGSKMVETAKLILGAY